MFSRYDFWSIAFSTLHVHTYMKGGKFPETAAWPSGEEDERREKKEEKTPVSSSKALFRFSSPIGFLQNRHIACRKMVS